MPRQLIVPLTIAVWREDGQWLSECLELGIGTFGSTPDDAASEAVDAVYSYLNTLEKLGERERVFAEKSISTYVGVPAEVHLPHLSRSVMARESIQVRPYEFPISLA
jgi:hypothetical protein